LGTQLAQAKAEALGGEVGTARYCENQKAAQLHHEFESLRAGDRIPANHFVTILEMPSGGTPDEHRDDFALLENELAKPVSSLAPGSEQVLLVQLSVGYLPVCSGFGGSDLKRCGAGLRMVGGK
jgi:hypothetical protein